MLELLPGFAENVVGISASGQVSASDYETVLIPAIEAAIQRYGTVRVLYVLGSAFTGFTAAAMWDDATVGISHLKAWERVAVVTDVDWIAGAVRVFGFAVPCPVKVFPTAQYPAALDWVVA